MVKDENFDMFKLAGVNPEEVNVWKKKHNLDHLPDKAALQLYSRVVLKKTLRAPYPVISVNKLWEKINAISSGVEARPASNKLYYGLKDVIVVGLSNTVTYTGCPICNRGRRTIGANKCAAHGAPVDLVERQWREWLVYDGDDEFVIKMNPSYSDNYNEVNMTGAVIYVEGVIRLTDDPIVMLVSRVLDFKPGNLLTGNVDDTEEGDFVRDTSGVDLEGFDEDLLLDEDLVEESEEVVEEISNGKAVEDFLNEFDDMMNAFVKRPVKKAMIERYLLDWMSENYPTEFGADENTRRQAIWRLAKGRYNELENNMISRV